MHRATFQAAKWSWRFPGSLGTLWVSPCALWVRMTHVATYRGANRTGPEQSAGSFCLFSTPRAIACPQDWKERKACSASGDPGTRLPPPHATGWSKWTALWKTSRKLPLFAAINNSVINVIFGAPLQTPTRVIKQWFWDLCIDVTCKQTKLLTPLQQAVHDAFELSAHRPCLRLKDGCVQLKEAYTGGCKSHSVRMSVLLPMGTGWREIRKELYERSFEKQV